MTSWMEVRGSHVDPAHARTLPHYQITFNILFLGSITRSPSTSYVLELQPFLPYCISMRLCPHIYDSWCSTTHMASIAAFMCRYVFMTRRWPF